MSDQPEKDPKELEEEHPDYVDDLSGSEQVDPPQANIATDPQSLPQEGTHKTVIAPDPAKVREAERKGRG